MRESFYKVVKTVASPLRFFAVALLLLCAIIVALSWKSSLPAEMTTNIIFVAFSTVIVLIILVSILVIFFPKKLVFDQEAHLTVLREKLGDSEFPQRYLPGELSAVEASKSLAPGNKQEEENQ